MPKKKKVLKQRKEKIVTKSNIDIKKDDSVENDFAEIFNENKNEEKKRENKEVIFEKEKGKNPNAFLLMAIAVLVVILGWFLYKKVFVLNKMKSKIIPEAIQKVAGPDMKITEIKDVKLQSGVYKFNIAFEGQPSDFTSYITTDGKIIFVQGLELSEFDKNEASAEATQTIPPAKSAKPKVELFVMSYCPYGLQMQKAYIPVAKLLAGKADMDIKFVDYVMHDVAERDENTNQYCIQQEQNDKFLTYLDCFVTEGDKGNTVCLDKAAIDKNKLKACVDKTNQNFQIIAKYDDDTAKKGSFPFYSLHTDLNVAYGVQGSPTLIINGTEATSGRSPEELKKVICSSFETEPAECETVLDTNQATPGFGVGVSSTATDASCS